MILGWQVGDSDDAKPHLSVVAPLSITIGVPVPRRASYELDVGSDGVDAGGVPGIEIILSGEGVLAMIWFTKYRSGFSSGISCSVIVACEYSKRTWNSAEAPK